MRTLTQADRMWCPFSRGVYLGDDKPDDMGGDPLLVTHNRMGGHDDGPVAAADYCRCVSVECMAWRWAEKEPENSGDRRGYCGLAGKPRFFSR